MRPCCGAIANTRSSSSVTLAARTRRGRSPVVMFTSPVANAPTSENDWFISWSSKNSGGDTQNWSKPIDGNRLVMNISWPAFG